MKNHEINIQCSFFKSYTILSKTQCSSLCIGENFQASYNLNPQFNHKAKSCIMKKKETMPRKNPKLQALHARNLASIQIQLWLQHKRDSFPSQTNPPKNRNKKEKKGCLRLRSLTSHKKYLGRFPKIRKIKIKK